MDVVAEKMTSTESTSNVPLKVSKTFAKHGWIAGDKVNKIDEVLEGEILINHSLQFDAVNLCRVTSINREQGIVYATFCSPKDVSKDRNGGNSQMEFGIWDFELANGQISVFYHTTQDLGVASKVGKHE